MLTGIRSLTCALLFGALIAIASASSTAAQDASWRVSKSSGEVWIDVPGAQPVALPADATLNPGASVRTGANGRVLLMRGAETIMVSPNSVILVPPGKSDSGGATKILLRSGSALFDVEKKNVRHFEVSTPYLAAVVKGTQFRVTIDEGASRVEVLRGQVQVTDYKSGQRALVNPSQTASVALRGGSGLALGGSGRMSPIEFGSPQVPPVSPLPVSPPLRSAATAEPPQQGAAPPAAAPPAAPPVAAPPAASPSQGATPAVAATRWSSSASGNGSIWGKDSASDEGDGFIARMREKVGLGRKRKGEDEMAIIAIPLAIGLSVFVGAMAIRRRRSKPEEQRRGRG